MKIKLLFALAAVAVIGMSCKKDEESGPSNSMSFKGENSTVVSATIQEFYTGDAFPSDTLDMNYTVSLLSFASAAGVVTVDVASLDSVVAAGTYNFVHSTDTNTANTNANAFIELLYTPLSGEAATTFNDGSGSLVVNSISSTNIDATLNFTSNDNEEVKVTYSGTLTSANQ